MIVVDANVVAYAFLEGDKTPLARALKERDPDWRVPRVWREEFANVLAVQVQAGRLKREQARGLLVAALDVLLPGESETDPGAAFELAMAKGISAYDAQYLALADTLGARLVTEDGALRRAAPARTASLAQAAGTL